MKRWVLFGCCALSLALPLAYPRPSFAQQKIAVRSGEHESYSRVVFDWGREVKFEIDESRKDLLIIRFKEPARLDLSGFDPSKLDNVTGFRILKNDPLVVSMIVPDESRIEAFNLMGKRFVVDVYAPGKAAAKDNGPGEPKPQPAPGSGVRKTEEAAADPPPVPPKKPEQTAAGPQKTDAAAAPLEQKTSAPKEDKKEPQAAPVSAQAEKPKAPEQFKQEAPKTAAELPHSVPPVHQPSAQEGKTGLNFTLVPETHASATPPPIAGQSAEPPKKTGSTEKPPPPVPSAAAPEPAPEAPRDAAITPMPMLKARDEPPPAPAAAPPPKIKADPASLHVLTVTSTSSVGLAVFEQDGELWFIADQQSHNLVPVINSKTPHIFAPFVGQEITGGQVYKTSAPAGYTIRARGGELAWKIVLDKQPAAEKPVEIERIVRGGSFSRGGKIVWPVKGATGVVDMTDPQSGRPLKIVTVKTSEEFAGPRQDFVDFTILRSVVGLAVLPKVDDLEVSLTERGVEIARPGGLAVLPESVVGSAALEEQPPIFKGAASAFSGPKIFNFGEWQRIPFAALEKNRNLVLAALPQYTKAARAEDLVALAKAYLLSGFGAEALGFLDFAAQELPDIAKNPEFIALQGMANAFDGKSDIALAYLQRPPLRQYEEVGYWKAYVLADLGDWQQAIDVLPANLGPFYEYPGQVSRRVALVLSEVLLRAGKVDKADDLLALVEHYKSDLDAPMTAALSYLRGESARQKGQKQRALDIWSKLEKGPDDLYRVKAGLAVTRLLDEEGAIPTEKVIDRLERLRYAWRGDEVEALVNYWLGDAYFRKKDYVKGLTIMRDAAEVAGQTELGRRVTADMSKAFTTLFMGPDLEKLSALDAVALYEQFSELSPPGAEGDRLARMLAEHLVRADLLDRAASILDKQVNTRLKGEDKIRVGKRLAVIHLLNRQPQKALATLSKIEDALKLELPGPAREASEYEITLLRARALAQDNRAEPALALLKDMRPDPGINRLRADISWQAGFWGEAADALGQVLEDQAPAGEPLNEKQAQILMNLAVALNLSSDRIAIANLREKYGLLMSKTAKAHQFEVITRARRNAVLADRETLMSVVSEVDLFKEFLDAYRSDAPAAAPQSN